MKIDSSQYIKPAVAYVQELMALASEKGFIISRVNAKEISNRLSDVINDIVDSMLKVRNRENRFYNSQMSRLLSICFSLSLSRTSRRFLE